MLSPPMVTNNCDSPSRGKAGNEREFSTRFQPRGETDQVLLVDETYTLLANRQRRKLLYHLREMNPAETTLESLVQHLAESDHVTIDGADDEEIRERLHLSLIHSHIPKLEQAAVIDWNERDKTIRYRGDPVLDELLDVSQRLERE